ncbi:MAG TPA: hypothetical protein VGW10_11295 [Solirubrobacteraceae bacterium]|nr:hypothetical protein [Solirubrobacteraceae bacterium]
MLWGSREAEAFTVLDTVAGGTRTLGKPRDCAWSETPRAAFAGAVVMHCPIAADASRQLLFNLRTGAARQLPAAFAYAAVGRNWLVGFDAQGDLFVHRRTGEVRRTAGRPRDLDDARLRRVCGRLRAGPATEGLAYDRTRYLVTTNRGLLLRPCARRGKTVRLERGRFAGFRLPDFATLSAGLVTWPAVGEGGVVLGYDARTKRRWIWLAGPDEVPLHTRNALLVRRVNTVFDLCGSVGCQASTWTADIARISRRPVRRRRGR